MSLYGQVTRLAERIEQSIHFRARRGLAIGTATALLPPFLTGLLLTAFVAGGGPAIPLGPDGIAVTDKFYLVHQPLTGDGSITVRVTSLDGLITSPPPRHDQIVSGVAPWAKAGVIIKDGTRQGSAYAAVMITGGNGVRMQVNYIHDTAGSLGKELYSGSRRSLYAAASPMSTISTRRLRNITLRHLFS